MCSTSTTMNRATATTASMIRGVDRNLTRAQSRALHHREDLDGREREGAARPGSMEREATISATAKLIPAKAARAIAISAAA